MKTILHRRLTQPYSCTQRLLPKDVNELLAMHNLMPSNISTTRSTSPAIASKDAHSSLPLSFYWAGTMAGFSNTAAKQEATGMQASPTLPNIIADSKSLTKVNPKRVCKRKPTTMKEGNGNYKPPSLPNPKRRRFDSRDTKDGLEDEGSERTNGRQNMTRHDKQIQATHTLA